MRQGPAALARLKTMAGAPAGSANNLMGPITEAARACAAVGEITEILRGVWGEFREPVSL